MSIEAAINTFGTVISCRELWDVLVAQMQDAGVSMVAYHATDVEGRLERISHEGFPQAWVDIYTSENFVDQDPFPDLAASMERPFYWHELADLLDMTPGQEKFLEAMKDTEVGDGVAFYLYGPRFQNAFMGLGFGESKVTLSDQQMFELQCIAQAAHLRYCFLSKDQSTEVNLSKRELEVLEWIAVGKSNSVIAEILTMSPHTVDSHVRRIFTKLNVRDRTTATLKGVGCGLIRMSEVLHT